MHQINDIAALRFPMPQPGDVRPADAYDDACEQVAAQREEAATNLEAASEGLDEDALLLALKDITARRNALDAEMRRLLAYGREFHGKRAYELDPLAEATGLTASGVRTAYGQAEVEQVERELHRKPNHPKRKDQWS
ncbi:hypothetical protein [Streptomyces sp. NPDC051776]|uniref:hypothetical protein n=1 Tax=Streptomyces sp. NPDC051776 TaxID=3155414 RepID=UPI0034301AAB